MYFYSETRKLIDELQDLFYQYKVKLTIWRKASGIAISEFEVLKEVSSEELKAAYIQNLENELEKLRDKINEVIYDFSNDYINEKILPDLLENPIDYETPSQPEEAVNDK